jgi:hypothetical protein
VDPAASRLEAVRIRDERRRTAWMPVREILEQVIPLLPVEHLVGVRRLVLLDEDYRRRKERAVGRYVPIRGTHAADIELYFDGYETLPLELRENRPLWARAFSRRWGTNCTTTASAGSGDGAGRRSTASKSRRTAGGAGTPATFWFECTRESATAPTTRPGSALTRAARPVRDVPRRATRAARRRRRRP